MSFRTVTYDLQFQRAERIEGILDNLQNKLNQLERIIERRPASAERLSRAVETYTNRIEQFETVYDNLTADLPKDGINTSFMVDPITGQNIGLFVDMDNSPYDKTYEGESLDMVVRASGRFNGRRVTFRDVFEDGQIVDDSGVFGFGSRSFGQMLNGKYEDVTLSFVNDANETVFTQNVISDYVPVI